MKNRPDLSDLASPGSEIDVRVTPRAGQNMIRRDADGKITIRVTAPPEDGKANAAVQKLLAKSLGLAKSRLRLVRGATARDKLFRVERSIATVDAFGHVERSGKVTHLRHGQGYFLYGIRARIILLDRYAFFKGVDGHVLLQGRVAFVDQCHNRRVKFVLDAEHALSLACQPGFATGGRACDASNTGSAPISRDKQAMRAHEYPGA